ncbi:MAG: DUF423 domain-containing protein [Planctomycetota bacterium]|nr:MAG: DUF423 domain-containing protein [Planctomycetota bacterium]
MKGSRWIALGGALGFVAVSAGAFGAHGLKSLPAERLAWWKTGSEYALAHALALVLAGLLASHGRGRASHVAAAAFATGTLLFSGSLWVMGLSGLRALGAVTPLGGLAFLVGWAAIAVAGFDRSRRGGSGAEEGEALPEDHVNVMP